MSRRVSDGGVLAEGMSWLPLSSDPLSSACELAQRSAPRVCPPCPACRSAVVVTRDVARHTGATLGAVAGAAAGAAGALHGAEVGSKVGAVVASFVGPAGPPLVTLGGALMGALFGGALGCEVGSAIGKAIDAKALPNYRCVSCGHVFGND